MQATLPAFVQVLHAASPLLEAPLRPMLKAGRLKGSRPSEQVVDARS